MNGSDWDPFISLFNDFLIVLKNEKAFSPAQLKYKEEDLLTAFKQYDQEVILTALQKYFEDSLWNRKVSDFLKREPLNMQKVAFIEKHLADERRYVQSFINGLSATYNDRRKKHSTSQKSYPITSLPVNNSIRSQIAGLLRNRTEQEIRDAFIVYCDLVIEGELAPKKFLPYFLGRNTLGEYTVVDDLLNVYNLNYVSRG